jgi:hypothetical protein
VDANLALLRKLNGNALRDTDIDRNEFRNFAMCLETSVGASILYDAGRENYTDFITSLEKVGVNFTPGEESNRETAVNTLPDAMGFSVRKIKLLNRLAACAREGSSLFHPFRLNVRINNIQESLKTIQQTLPRN